MPCPLNTCWDCRRRLTQFAGRLHRLHDGKREVRIYDYVDLNVAVCARMYDRRAKGYEAIGYKVVVPVGTDEGWPVSIPLPSVPHWKETFADSVRRLCREGVDEALANLFVYATLQFDLNDGIRGRPTARAAVVKFLFERLESRAETKGVFRLGERLPILCGTNPSVEADLLDAAHKLAVMLDVSAELSDLDAYRRARREDWLLQRNGYRVVRLLAEDVCARLDETLAFIECGIR